MGNEALEVIMKTLNTEIRKTLGLYKKALSENIGWLCSPLNPELIQGDSLVGLRGDISSIWIQAVWPTPYVGDYEAREYIIGPTVDFPGPQGMMILRRVRENEKMIQERLVFHGRYEEVIDELLKILTNDLF